MDENKITITPKTRVGELLDAYPFLEEVLLDISPVFSKLKNPVLRKTVAKVASLQQAAIVGGMPVEELVNRLRTAAGQEALLGLHDDVSGSSEEPEWYSPDRISDRFDATAMINVGDNPMNEVLTRARKLADGAILELVTPFRPAPLIDLLKEKGYKVWSRQDGNKFSTYFLRN
jgi:hypothetical protein